MKFAEPLVQIGDFYHWYSRVLAWIMIHKDLFARVINLPVAKRLKADFLQGSFPVTHSGKTLDNERSIPRGELPLQFPAIVGHGKATQEVEYGYEDIGFPAESHPLRLGEHRLRRLENIKECNDNHEGCIFEC